MKSIVATILIASAAIVQAQISALPPCGIVCGLQAANATNCSPVTNFNCTCQYSNQAIILPILSSCLAKTCDNSTQSAAAISAGEGICATVSQTASSLASYGTSAGPPTSYATASAASSVVASSSAAPSAAGSSSASASATSSPSSTYTGAAAMITAGVEALAAMAGMAVLVL